MAATDAQPAVSQDFIDAWESFFRAARRARGRANQGSGDGLTLSQLHLVQPLTSGPQGVGALADCAGVAPPTASRMLDGLARAGLVDRIQDPDDRRAVLVSLTDEGRRAVQQKRRSLNAIRRRIAAGLTPAEQAEAAPLLRRLAEVMDEL
jgi:MarR family transcriptional regulator, organic hydroperoxide resistance regulator